MALIVHIEFSYELYESAELESDPEFHFFVTQWISKEFRIHKVNRLRGHVRATLKFKLEDNVVTKHANQVDAMLRESMFSIDAFAFLLNKNKERCLNQAGGLLVFFSDLFKAEKDDLAATLDIPALAGEESSVKGKVIFHRSKCSLRLDLAHSGSRTPMIGGELINASAWETPVREYAPCESYVAQCRQMMDALPVTYKRNANIGVFNYVCRVGRLPGAGFVHAPLAATSERYYANAVRVVLERRGMSEKEFLDLDIANSKRDAFVASCVLADMLSAYVDYGNYILDEVCVITGGSKKKKQFELRPIEDFYNMRIRRGALDCEDTSCEIACIEAQEFAQLKTSLALLQKLQFVKSMYISGMLLDGVSNVEINLSKGKSSDAEDGDPMQAHMSGILIPLWLAREWCSDKSIFRVFDNNLIEQSKIYRVRMLEGTGFLKSEGVLPSSEETEDRLRRELTRSDPSAFGPLRKRYVYDAGSTGESDQDHQSEFYKSSLLFLTNEFSLRGIRITIFVFSPKRANALSVGVRFQDLASSSVSIILTPEPEMIQADWDKMMRYKLDLHPLPPLEPPRDNFEDDMPMVKESRRNAESLKQSLDAMVRPTRAATTTNVEFFVKYEHLTLARMRSMVRVLQRYRLVSVRVREERITPEHGGFQLVLGIANK